MNTRICEKIVESGVSNIIEFGYTDVTKENIFTDMIYSRFFKSMLNDAFGMGYDEEVNYLLSKFHIGE